MPRLRREDLYVVRNRDSQEETRYESLRDLRQADCEQQTSHAPQR